MLLQEDHVHNRQDSRYCHVQGQDGHIVVPLMLNYIVDLTLIDFLSVDSWAAPKLKHLEIVIASNI